MEYGCPRPKGQAHAPTAAPPAARRRSHIAALLRPDHRRLAAAPRSPVSHPRPWRRARPRHRDRPQRHGPRCPIPDLGAAPDLVARCPGPRPRLWHPRNPVTQSTQTSDRRSARASGGRSSQASGAYGFTGVRGNRLLRVSSLQGRKHQFAPFSL
jgi:hypothetical protein